ncbi:MAG TPA: asparagine synthase (glutamine-hydrolyzing) [Aestuariivirgaceae bacterium]
MCGITGCINLRSDKPPLEGVIRSMIAPLVHRGPDGEGIWLDRDAGVALGHRRLAVLDLTPAGRQPMASPGGRYVLVFNGEIYNHLELRKKLETAQSRTQRATWRGHSDTETLLAGFEEWGVVETIRRAVGMFAFAVWDKDTKTLLIARDRLGEKPLYYGWQGNAFLFGSELKALRRHPAFRGEINRDALTLLLRFNHVPCPYSIYRGIHKLPPGTHLTVSDGRRDARPTQYWSACEHAERGQREPFSGSADEAIGELERLMMQSVAGQMVADVPLGVFLSGGVDSSTITALMQRVSPTTVRTFTIGFHEAGYDEAESARAVARHLRTEHTELYITPAQALAVIPKLPQLYDEPFGDSSQIPTFLLSEMARRHVTVSLSGDGGDEVFGGYNRYAWAGDIWHMVRWLPTSVRTNLAVFLTGPSAVTLEAAFRSLGRLLPRRYRHSEPGVKLQKIADILVVKSPEDIYAELVSHWKRPADLVIDGAEPETVLTGAAGLPSLSALEHRMMYLDLVSYLPDDILAKIDRAAMGVSLETRVPFLDHRVVEFAWRLPISLKLRDGVTKWILRQILYREVPRKLIERPKAGFGVPIDSWLRGPLRHWAEKLLDANRLSREGFLHPKPILVKWREHLEGRRNWQHYLWNVLMFQAWLESSKA